MRRRARWLAAIVLAAAPAAAALAHRATPTSPHAAAAPGAALGQRIDRLLVAATTPGEPGTSVAVVVGGRLAYQAAAGLADLEHDVPLRPDTPLEIASLSKQLTAFAAALLAARGRLDLGADVHRYLPELPAYGTPVTVEELVHHTSGIKDVAGLAALAGIGGGDALSMDGALALVAREPALAFPPGSAFAYSNSNYLLLARAVERAAGESLRSFCARELFAPAGMTRTHVGDLAGEVVPGRALPYRRDARGHWLRAREADGAYGATGVVSTAEDLARWATVLLRGKLGGAALPARILDTGKLADGSDTHYAFGLHVDRLRGERAFGHAGSEPGFGGAFWVYPDRGLAVVVLSNGSNGDPGRLADAIVDLVLGPRAAAPPPPFVMLDDGPYEPPAASRGLHPPASDLDRLAGRYREVGGEREYLLLVEDGGLVAAPHGERPHVPLFPLPGGRFFFPRLGWELEFPRRPDGAAGELLVHVTASSVRRGPPRDVRFARVPSAPLSPAEAGERSGWYWNAHLGSLFHVEADGGALVLDHPRLGSMPLRAWEGDTFQLDSYALSRATFLHQDPRDETTPVVGLRLVAYAWSTSADFVRLPARQATAKE